MKRFEGKLFGAALGFSFGGPIGAIVGAVVGHFIDSSLDKRVGAISSNQRELAFITSLVLLLVGTAKADGKITDNEIETIKRFFGRQLGYRGRELYFIERIINESLHRDVNLKEVCSSIVERTSYEERLFLIQLNYQVAVSDGILSKEEEMFIQKASTYLGIEPYDFAAIKNSFYAYSRGGYSNGKSRYTGEREEVFDPYRILGINRDSSNEEIHKAYRNLANKYHPDKVAHLGREFIELANEKFTQIQKAYETVKKERGIG